MISADGKQSETRPVNKLCLLTALLVILTPIPALAWNYTGHRVIASIAYRQLDDQTKRKIAEVLKKPPASADFWMRRSTNGPNEVFNLLWNASVFPDDAPAEPWRRYARSLAHYVNYRIQRSKVEPAGGGEDGATHHLVPGKHRWPQCHPNQVVPATGLVDDVITPRESQALRAWLESLTGVLAGVMVFQRFDDVSLMAA